MVRMVLMLANIFSNCSGSVLNPSSVSTRDWLISWIETHTAFLMQRWLHLVDILIPARLTGLSAFTFLSRHFDRHTVAERPSPSARCVHFVLDAAVDNPKLYLKPRNTDSRMIHAVGRLNIEQLRNQGDVFTFKC